MYQSVSNLFNTSAECPKEVRKIPDRELYGFCFDPGNPQSQYSMPERRLIRFRRHFSRPLLYHERCLMRFSSCVYRQRSREMLPHFSRPLLYHKCEGRIGGTAKREEAAPADSQFLQAQGHITSFVLKYKDPGQLYHKVEGELAVPQSGRRPFRPTANFSRPRDSSHRLSSNIKTLGNYITK